MYMWPIYENYCCCQFQNTVHTNKNTFSVRLTLDPCDGILV